MDAKVKIEQLHRMLRIRRLRSKLVKHAVAKQQLLLQIVALPTPCNEVHQDLNTNIVLILTIVTEM